MSPKYSLINQGQALPAALSTIVRDGRQVMRNLFTTQEKPRPRYTLFVYPPYVYFTIIVKLKVKTPSNLFV
jgi:hypothetical protein